MKVLPPFRYISVLENATGLDPAIDKVKSVVVGLLHPRWLEDILHGVPIGHPLHPVAVLVPVGAWTSAAVLDLVPGTEKSARLLVGTGILSALPSAAAGWADWSRLHKQQQRVGLVHAATNITGVVLYSAAFVQRSRGKILSGKVLSFAGFAAVMTGGVLGGHLSFRQASGANHAEDVPHRIEPGWHDVGTVADIPLGRLTKRMVGDEPVVLLRSGDDIHALSNTCSHLSGPLDEGELIDGDDPCVTCPWHASMFSMTTGDVVHGPATSPQPRFETRVSNGRLELRLPTTGQI
ncbi:Rieske (2Fe-2S) protein [Planctomonas psychrotolerans]|uniref:Rieske (2Fe-2S) protein n=1 Tax=Planctomonas psychrotolerans TaxID=2528712 RepID=UPI00123C793A|nr:Rieske (2Fe-2S) protein [Planctomonas psychrotolerans]